MKIIVLAIGLVLSGVAHAQALAPSTQQTVLTASSAPPSVVVIVKKTPASDALNQAAKDLTAEQKAFDTALGTAKTSLEAEQKGIAERLQTASKTLNEKLKADKKYAGDIKSIEDMQAQIVVAGQKAQEKFTATAGALSGKLSTDKTLVDSLTPIVRKENDLPATATFDVATQTWK